MAPLRYFLLDFSPRVRLLAPCLYGCLPPSLSRLFPIQGCTETSEIPELGKLMLLSCLSPRYLLACCVARVGPQCLLVHGAGESVHQPHSLVTRMMFHCAVKFLCMSFVPKPGSFPFGTVQTATGPPLVE